jgi:hypothetical protein
MEFAKCAMTVSYFIRKKLIAKSEDGRTFFILYSLLWGNVLSRHVTGYHISYITY